MKLLPSLSRYFPRVLLTGLLCAVATSGFSQSPQILVHDGGHDDRGNAAATDGNGSLFVAGYSNVDATPVSFAVLKYNAAGGLQWLVRPQLTGDYTASTAADVATDPAGNVYAVGYATKPLPFLQRELGLLVTSFSPSGVQRWTQVFNGPGNSFDSARGVAVDALQGVYVIGITDDAFGRADWLTIKYSLSGVEQWR